MDPCILNTEYTLLLTTKNTIKLSGITIIIFKRLNYPGNKQMEDRWHRILNYMALQYRYNVRGMT
jgi:hypothetical protein